MTTTLHHFIDGKRVEGKSGRVGDVFNPATGDVTAQVPLATADEVREAIRSSAAALPGWAATPPARRTQILFKFRELLIAHTDELAEMLSAEHGKTLPDAKGELGRGIEVVEFACGIPQALKGEYSENVGSNIDSYTIRQPVGVVAGITPFNFPAMVPMWMYPVALACGNTFVLKPSERDPSVALRIAELATEAGLPDGVLNVINGDKEAVDTLLTDPQIDAVSFVGSTAIGEYIYKTGCANGKRVQALCGAKNHLVVMPDADMDLTVDALIGAGYGSAGERCMAVSVAVTIGDETADELVKRLEPKVRALKVGPYSDPDSEMGPVISRESQDRIKDYVAAGVEDGADLVVDGRSPKVDGYEDGFFVGGTLIDNVKPEMECYTDEIFGPVLCVVRVDTMQQAMDLIDRHEYGNGTCIFTRDGEAARYFSDHIEVGMVGINVPLPVPVSYHSFGGWKRSLFGDLSAYGPDAVRFYTRRKTITQRWPSAGVREGIDFSFPSNG